MIIPDNFGKEIKEMAESLIKKNHCETPFADKNIQKQMQCYAISAIIYYHCALREQLIDSGIDIGELTFLPLPENEQ